MRNKWIKSIVSLLLVLIMVLTSAPLTNNNVEAAIKPKLSVKQITLTKGMTQTFKANNIKSGSSVKWSSSDKTIATVSAKGVVKGIKDGKATIKCVVNTSGKKTTLKCPVTVKTPKFTKSSYSVTKGKSIVLELKNKYSKATYKWSSSDKKIAKVSSKGKVTGIASGEVTITVNITIPKSGTRSAKTITRTAKVKVENDNIVSDYVVSTQTELDKALSDKNVSN